MPSERHNETYMQFGKDVKEFYSSHRFSFRFGTQCAAHTCLTLHVSIQSIVIRFVANRPRTRHPRPLLWLVSTYG